MWPAVVNPVSRTFKVCRALALAVTCSAALGGASANAAVIYLEDFEGGVLGSEWSGAGAIETTGGLSAFGFDALHLRNAGSSATILTLSGLAPHTETTLEFDLAMWDSIDLGGDTFQLTADGVTLYSTDTDFGNYYPDDDISHGPGVHITETFGDFTAPGYGQNAGFRDAGRAAVFTFAHSASSLVLAWVFPTSQGGSDESFGLDNIRVLTNATSDGPPPSVPEPATLSLVALGAAALVRRAGRR